MSDSMRAVGTSPPRIATWLVRRLCVRTQLEALEGDLLELYERRSRSFGLRRARLLYVRDVLGACLRYSRLAPWFRRAVHFSLVNGALLLTWGWLLNPLVRELERRLVGHPLMLEVLSNVVLCVVLPLIYVFYAWTFAKLTSRRRIAR